jgi:hypothetical protein
MRQITLTALREEARTRAYVAVQELAALNRRSVAGMSSSSPGRIPEDRLHAILEVCYTRFVSRWSAVTPK